MPTYEYKLVPAPEKALKHKGLKGAASFAATLEDILNELGRDGWRYLRADTLPQEERSGLTGKQTTYRNILVFIRDLPEMVQDPAPEPVADLPAPAPAPAPAPEPIEDTAEAPSLANLLEPREDTGDLSEEKPLKP